VKGQTSDSINKELNYKLLQSVVAEANDAVLITKAYPVESPDGPEIIYVNRSFEVMTGYKAEEVIGKTPRVLQGRNSESEQLQKLREAIKKQESITVEVLNYSKKGDEYWINISMSPIFDGGKCTHFISIQRDITERKLREFQEKLTVKISQIFNKSDSVKEAIDSSIAEIIELKNFDAVEFWITDEDKKSIKLLSHKVGNPEIEEIYKKSSRFDTLKKGEGLPGVTWKKQKKLFWNALDKRNEFNQKEIKSNGRLKTGVSFPIINEDEVEGVLILLLSEDLKSEPYYVSLFNDVSAILALEIRRKKLEEQLKRIFEISPDIVALVNHQGYYKKINPAMVDLLGYAEDEIINHPYIKFVHPDDKKTTNEVKQSFYKGNPVHNYKNRYITKSGLIKWIQWTATPYPDEELVLAIGRDITEQKALEELLDQANQLAKIGSWEVDFEKNKVYWSDVTKSIYGVSIDFEPTMENGLDFYKIDSDREKVLEVVQNAIDYGTPWDIEVLIETSKGEEKWVRSIGNAEKLITGSRYQRLFGSFQDIHNRKIAELKLQERNRHIDAIASLNSSLLNYENWFEDLKNHMEMIGEAVQADRVYYFENSYDPITGEGFTSQKLEWCREGITSQMDNPDLEAIPFKEVPELVDPMLENRPSSESLSSIKKGTTTRHVMEDQNIKTFLAIPITINGKFFGFVGFDNCTDEVKWNEQEVRTLSTITSNLAVAIERHQAGKKLIDKTRQLDAIAQFNGFLIKEEGWQEALDKSLEMFCKVAAADRVYYFEYSYLEKTGQDVVSMKLEWVREGIKPEIENPDHTNLPFDDIRNFIDMVIHDGGYNDIVSKIEDEKFSGFLAGQDIKSILVIPVFTANGFRGFIGFDDCTNERIWADDEVTLLKTVAINLGSAIENEESEKAFQKVFEERIRILESIGDGFFALDSEFTVEYWNKQAEELLFTQKEKVLGVNLWNVFDKDLAPKSYSKYKKAIKEKVALSFEDYYEPIDKWFDINVYPSDRGISVFFKDITDKRRAEKKLKELNVKLEQHAKELAASNSELEQFAFVASHDLQEPLRMITSFLAQIERKYEDILDEKGKKYIHFAVDGANRMRNIIQDLLEYSRVGRVNVKQEEVDLNEILESVKILQRNVIEEKKATITWKSMPTVEANKGAIQQLFQNLIQNALNYQKKGSIPEIKIWTENLDTHWKFYVRDNGIGIDPQYKERIFAIFQRLHGKEEYSGTGVGLAICKKIVEDQGGSIGVDSEVGSGSTFYFTIAKNQITSEVDE